MRTNHNTRAVSWPGRLILAMTLVFLTGCILGGCDREYSQPTFENVSIVMTQAPCIANVCVGTVGRQEVIEKLSQNEFLYNIRDNGGAPVWFRIEESAIGGGIIFQQDEFGAYEVVERVRLDAVGMPLGTVLDTLGEPEELFLMFGCGRGWHAHGKLFYRDKGIEVQVQFPVKVDERAIPITLTDKTPVGWIWYFDPSLYDEWLLEIYEDLEIRSGYFSLAPSVTAEMLATAVQPWPGLGVPIETLDLCPRR
jgi:hypothetical protein